MNKTNNFLHKTIVLYVAANIHHNDFLGHLHIKHRCIVTIAFSLKIQSTNLRGNRNGRCHTYNKNKAEGAHSQVKRISSYFLDQGEPPAKNVFHN